MEKRNPLQVDRFHRVLKLMNDRKMTTPPERQKYIGLVLEEPKNLSQCTAEELRILLNAFGEAPQEGAQTA